MEEAIIPPLLSEKDPKYNINYATKDMPNLIIETKEGICTITISRPKNRNAFNDDLAMELCEAFGKATRDPKAKCIVFTGDPAGNAFCAGADLGGNGDLFKLKPIGENQSKRPLNAATYRDAGGLVGLAITNCTKPVICALNGAAVGVGLTVSSNDI